MDSDVIKAFNKLLVSMQECKGGIVSKQKVVDITKAAMNAVRYFKHVVFIVERYLVKVKEKNFLGAFFRRVGVSASLLIRLVKTESVNAIRFLVVKCSLFDKNRDH
ncbi:unnamed protein product [Meloidogyne enterolobii]|uniref:Uncharacterized protein n=1 Tax=Meloidogyne enterolobii TaxID=390850 RepID=A0ACB1AKF8_MELEN